MHSDELRALEQSFQDQLSALQLRVTALECRLHPASLRAAGSDSGSNLSVVVGESLTGYYCRRAQPALVAVGDPDSRRPPIPAADLLVHSQEC